MSFLCCGIKYSKSDNDTYWCIETDLIKNFTKTKIGNEKVSKEVVETLICKVCGCSKVQIKRFGRVAGKFKVLEVEKLSGEKADLFLINTQNIRIRQPQKSPMKLPPNSKTIPPCYGKVLSAYTQRARYLNEQGWGYKSEIIYSECKIKKIQKI